MLNIGMTAKERGHGVAAGQPARLPVMVRLRMARVAQKLDQAAVADLRGWDLSAAQFDVLAQVGAAEGKTQAELAASLLVTKGNITQLLDRMEAAGLIVRRPDGRCNRLYLTRAGRALYERVVPAHEAQIARRLSALTPDEQVQILRLLRKLDRALG